MRKCLSLFSEYIIWREKILGNAYKMLSQNLFLWHITLAHVEVESSVFVYNAQYKSINVN